MTALRVPCAATSAALVRHRLCDDLALLHVPEPVVDAAALVVSELVSNAVRHGSALPSGGLIARWSLALSRPAALHVEVEEGGPGPAAPGAAGLAADADGESGRGLALVAVLARSWGSRCLPTSTTVWAELPLDDPVGGPGR